MMTLHRIGLMGLLLLGLIGCAPTQVGGLIPSAPTSVALEQTETKPAVKSDTPATPVALEQTETKPAVKSDTPATPVPLLPERTPGPIDIPASPQAADKFIGLAKTDLAGRLKIEVEQVTLIDATTITWPDSALGCPEPGKVYAQGRVPGFKIQLQAGDKSYVYHTDQTGQIVFCPELLPDEPGGEWLIPPGPTPRIGVPIK